MFKIIFWIFIGYMICSTNSCSTMKEVFVDSGAKIAVAKLSEPLKKTTTDSLTIRVRLDY